MQKKVLVVAAHTDDEALGCGGTLARHAAEGDTVFAIFMADGVTSRASSSLANSTPEEMQQRQAAAQKAAQLLGIKESFYLGFPDNRMDSLALLDIVQPLEKLIAQLEPEIIYTHHAGDLNIDHRVTHQAVLTACRPVPNSSVKEIYAFEVLSATEWNTPGQNTFAPNVFIDISQQLATKRQALEAYQLEMRPEPHARSIANLLRLAEFRGNSVGLKAAEAFELIRRIDAAG